MVGNPPAVLAHEGYVRNQLVQQRNTLTSGSRASEPPEFRLGTAGVCRLYQLSGYLALAADGRMVPLTQYCQQQRNWVWYEEGKFWRKFREAANSETMAFTQTLNQHEVEAYAGSICASSDDGTTMQELREIQADQQLPADFERTVTVAAVKTYCRQHRSALSRNGF